MTTPNMTGADCYPWLTGHWSFFIRRLEQDRLAHALMIEGPAGSGKNDLASAMVARLLCTEDQASACGQCRSCILFAGGAHPDYFDVHPEEDSKVIKVDQVRELIGRLDLTTTISARKVAYIHPAETMTASAANALLKSLEEPAGNTVLILVSDHPGRLPVTIHSRCQSICVTQPDSRLVLDWLKDSGAVSMVCSTLNELNPAELWRWLSMCTGDVIKSIMAGTPLNWLPEAVELNDRMLLQLQKQADINRQLSATPVRGDLLLQDWLIRWAEQIV
jgi:DNA polymerase-3 subunit delta'